MSNHAGVTPDEPNDFAIIGPGGLRGWLLLWLQKLQLPVIRVGRRRIYRVLLQGDGFSLPITGGEPAVGFYTTRFVAAASEPAAEASARSHVLSEWQGLSLMSELTGTSSPRMVVEGVEPVEGWFRLRTGLGFTFYTGSG